MIINMPHKLISDFLKKPCSNALEDTEWYKLCQIYGDLGDNKRSLLIKALTAHSGVPEQEITDTFSSLMAKDPLPEKEILSSLLKTQDIATSKIVQFQQRKYIQEINTAALSISRAEWLTLITKFEQQKARHLTSVFFLTGLSTIRNIGYEHLQFALSKEQPSRKVKKIVNHQELPPLKRSYQKLIEDGGINPLILGNLEEHNEKYIELQKKLKKSGVRITTLSAASPEKGYPVTVSTPGGTKARPVCAINEHTFFKPITPYGNKSKKARVDVRTATENNIGTALPQLPYERAKPIEFNATLDSLKARSGQIRRQSQKSLKKASSSDVFKAHGIEINPSDSQSHHWAHLIAYFLGGPQDGINLVPSTAAANYNTLEAIELFIKKKLTQSETSQIHITVEPIYSGQSLIPDVLIYTLTWKEERLEQPNQDFREIFHINPQSYQRITKSMHQAIEVLRNERDERDENSTPVEIKL